MFLLSINQQPIKHLRTPAFGRGNRNEPTVSELQRLYDEAKRVGHKAIMPALENSLSSA
jgi:hypothetical protein